MNFTTTPDVMCFPITLLEDSVIENRERFDVFLSSDDQLVVVDRTQSRVFIEDTSSKLPVKTQAHSSDFLPRVIL